MKEKILTLLGDIRPEFDFKDSNDYITDGFLDSFDVVTLVSELENEFSVTIDGMDIIPENFENVSVISKLIERSDKRA